MGAAAAVMRRVVVVVAAAYTACAVVALWLIPASVHGWLGVASDPLSALPAMALAMPWSALLGLLPDGAPVWMSGLLLAAGMAANAALLWWLARRLSRRSPAG